MLKEVRFGSDDCERKHKNPGVTWERMVQIWWIGLKIATLLPDHLESVNQNHREKRKTLLCMCLWPSLLFYCTTEHSLTKATDLAVKKLPVLAVQQKNVTSKPRWWRVGVSTPLGSSLGFGDIFILTLFPLLFAFTIFTGLLLQPTKLPPKRQLAPCFWPHSFWPPSAEKVVPTKESHAASAAKNSICKYCVSFKLPTLDTSPRHPAARLKYITTKKHNSPNTQSWAKMCKKNTWRPWEWHWSHTTSTCEQMI